jgi:hypothetical protein
MPEHNKQRPVLGLQFTVSTQPYMNMPGITVWQGMLTSRYRICLENWQSYRSFSHQISGSILPYSGRHRLDNGISHFHGSGALEPLCKKMEHGWMGVSDLLCSGDIMNANGLNS